MLTADRAPIQRVSAARPCPVCGRADWCLVSEDGAVAICPRTEAGSVKRCGEAGWLHRLADAHYNDKPHVQRVRMSFIPVQRFDERARRASQNVDHQMLNQFATKLGVSTESLIRLRIGWDGVAWTFPMADHRGRVIGIRRRLPNGGKRAVYGSRNGLFVPTNLPATGWLLIAEGESDCAALLTIGFACIGRPNCSGSISLVARISRGRHAVLVSDRDEPGRRGAERLAGVLVGCCRSVRITIPPTKDVRDWVRTGAGRDDVTAMVERAPIWKLRIRSCGSGDNDE